MTRFAAPFLAAACFGLVAPAAAAMKGDVQAITRLEDAWRQARIDADTGFLERFYAPELRIQNMNGAVQSRADDIAIFKTGKIKPEIIAHSPLDITVYGATAVVTGIDHMVGKAFGTHGEVWLRFTDVLVKRGGRWQLVIQQATPTQDRW